MMMNPAISQRATRYAVSWRVRVRRVDDSKWNVARAVNLSVSGILLQLPQRHRVGERLECEIDCRVRPEMKTMLRGVGEIVRHGKSRHALAAIHFDVDGASLVSSGGRAIGQPPPEAKL
jgi:hypothetical protein